MFTEIIFSQPIPNLLTHTHPFNRSSMSVATSEASFVASVAAVCAAYRSVSWKVLLSAGLVYGAAYAAERLAWTGRAKERATKRQFAAFVAA